MNTPVDSRSAPAPVPRPPVDAAVAARRRLLRLVAGGVPLMAGPPAIANQIAASSAYRAARNDGNRPMPSLHVEVQEQGNDRWVRQPVDVVKLGTGNSADSASAFDAYRIVDGVSSVLTSNTRYYRLQAPHERIDLQASSLVVIASVPARRVYMLVLFNKSDINKSVLTIIPGLVDPMQYYSSLELQGLHCSSWSSIYPGVNPVSCGV
jgi:hypothetical protein